jgi:hypothetical protein
MFHTLDTVVQLKGIHYKIPIATRPVGQQNVPVYRFVCHTIAAYDQGNIVNSEMGP